MLPRFNFTRTKTPSSTWTLYYRLNMPTSKTLRVKFWSEYPKISLFKVLKPVERLVNYNKWNKTEQQRLFGGKGLNGSMRLNIKAPYFPANTPLSVNKSLLMVDQWDYVFYSTFSYSQELCFFLSFLENTDDAMTVFLLLIWQTRRV